MPGCTVMELFRLQVQPDLTFLARLNPAEDVTGFVFFLLLPDFLFSVLSRHVAMAMFSTWSTFSSMELI